MMNKFIQALPAQLALFVRAGMIDTFHDALYAAKIGEAHSYRCKILVNSPPASHPVSAMGTSTEKPNTTRQEQCYVCKAFGHFKLVTLTVVVTQYQTSSASYVTSGDTVHNHVKPLLLFLNDANCVHRQDILPKPVFNI